MLYNVLSLIKKSFIYVIEFVSFNIGINSFSTKNFDRIAFSSIFVIS